MVDLWLIGYIVVNYHADKLEQWSILNNISIYIFSNFIEREVNNEGYCEMI
jgi:hypothetical protein